MGDGPARLEPVSVFYFMPTKQFNQLFHDSHSWKKTTCFSNISVTPELASDILTLNTYNRPVKPSTLKPSTLKLYVENMKKDQWRFNGDTLRISKTGSLLDGQHRLLAISQSGMPQVFNIQTGLEDNSFEVMDIGKNRSAGDVLAVKGYKYQNVLAGAIRLVMVYDSMNTGKLKYWPDGLRFTNIQISEWPEKHNIELMVNCVTQAQKMYGRSRILQHNVYAAFYYIFSRKNRESADNFFYMLSSGEDITANKVSSIYMLRQRLINMLNSRLALRNVSEKYAIIIKAWNFYRDDKEVKKLSYAPDQEEFPKAI